MSVRTPRQAVRLEFLSDVPEGRIALVTINNPPLNIGSLQVRRDLMDVFSTLQAEIGLMGVILRGANGNFVAGSDIREFDGPPVPPHLPEIIAAIEGLPVPVIAAIEGAALGGGYELALGCDYRLAAPNAVVGLPEVTLGFVPGAGGTYRLPRLVGQSEAIELITTGKRLKAKEAASKGMVDKVEDGDLVASACRLIREGVQKRVLRDLPARVSSPAELDAAAGTALRKARGAHAVAEAIAVVRRATDDAQTALQNERQTFLNLRRGAQSQALRHLFLAERAASRPPEGARSRSVSRVGVVGAGRMGAGIALALASRGFPVQLAEQNDQVLEAALKTLAEQAAHMAERGRVDSAEAVVGKIAPGSLEKMADCDLVIEAIIEDMETKTSLFAELARIVDSNTILASNTSYLDINALAANVPSPERVAGMHFFNPAHVMKLVEVIRAEEVSPDVVATLLTVSRRLGKVPVVARVGEGFIGNRIFAAYRTQCEFLLEEGALPEQVDAAMKEFGMAMGPFAVFDLAGLDIAWTMRKRLAASRPADARYVEIPDLLCEEGRFGRKIGKGWYDYSSGEMKPDRHVRAVIEQTSLKKGIERREIPADAIRERLLAAMVNESAWVLADGIAERTSDIDLVLVHGYGFPALKGGVLHWAARQPRQEMLSAVRRMAEVSGPGVTIAPNLEAVLKEAEAI